MNQSVPMEVPECAGQLDTERNGVSHREPGAGFKFGSKSAGTIRTGVLEWWSVGGLRGEVLFFAPALRHSITLLYRIVRKLHHVVETTRGIVASDVQHVYDSRV